MNNVFICVCIYMQARDVAKELICGLANPKVLVDTIDVEGQFKVGESGT